MSRDVPGMHIRTRSGVVGVADQKGSKNIELLLPCFSKSIDLKISGVFGFPVSDIDILKPKTLPNSDG